MHVLEKEVATNSAQKNELENVKNASHAALGPL